MRYKRDRFQVQVSENDKIIRQKNSGRNTGQITNPIVNSKRENGRTIGKISVENI